MKNSFYLMLLVLVTAACQKSEIDTWEAKACVWFSKANDTIPFSFYSQPEEVTEYTLEIPVSMAGRVVDSDREIAVKDLGGSPFNPGSRYEVVSAFIPKGETMGTIRVKVHKTDNLKVARDTIGFEIVASDQFEVGLGDYLYNAIIISNFLSKPAWWDDNVISYLGYYSDKKLGIIYTVFGSDEIFNSGKSWYGDEITVAIYQLNRYCKTNNIKYNPTDTDYIHFESRSN